MLRLDQKKAFESEKISMELSQETQINDPNENLFDFSKNLEFR